MKIVFSMFVAAPILVVIYFIILGQQSRTGTAKGLIDGKLHPCPSTPNCVCSEQYGDTEDYTTAFKLTDNDDIDSWAILKMIIIELKGEIQIENTSYMSAIFTSTLFGFVDDVEMRLDSEQGFIHFRSASRVGHSDFGANKKRIAMIKKRFVEKTTEGNK